MKTTKQVIITTVVILASGLITSCAHTPGEIELTARGVRYFHCAPSLDATSCHLVRSAARCATQEGYPTVEDPEQGLEFMPPPDGVRTAFLRGVFAAGQTIGRVPLVERHGIQVWCRFIPGGVELRDGEIVTALDDGIFKEGR